VNYAKFVGLLTVCLIVCKITSVMCRIVCATNLTIPFAQSLVCLCVCVLVMLSICVCVCLCVRDVVP